MNTIALVGGVGVGKSYLGRQLAERLPLAQFIEEDASDNIFISEFYEDMKKWGFHSRISMLTMTVTNMLKVRPGSKYVIYDRCVQELIVFAKKLYEDGNLSEKEFKLYLQLYDAIIKVIPSPDIYIYCYCSPETALQRIHKRGRDCESKVRLNFCYDVLKRYSIWRNELSGVAVIDLDTETTIDLEKITKNIINIYDV
jgi:deoxyadenosine/deoxycytidine kinase